jgi:4-amino-4-deoxy-L-arabinose transferase-like glycosyltransferase
MRSVGKVAAGTGRHWPLLGLAALLLFSSLLCVRVVNRDTVPLVADAAGYYRTALRLDRLVEADDISGAARLLLQPGLRPPLPQLVTVGLFRLTQERSQRVARHSVLPFLWILLVATYAIGSRLKDPPTGLVAAVLLGCFPQVIGFSRCYWMDLPLAGMTALGLWALLATDRFSRRGAALIFGCAVGLGMLTKYTFGVFLVGPLVYTLVSAWRATTRQPFSRRNRRLLLENVSLALLVATAICGPWYAHSAGAAWDNFLFNQGAGVLRARPIWTLGNLSLYSRHLCTVQIGLPATALLLLALPLFLRHAPRSHRWLLVLWVGVPYLFFTFVVQGAVRARFTLPYLPAVALVMAVGVMQFRFHRPLRALACAAGVVALWGHLVLSVRPLPPGVFPWNRINHRGLLASQSFAFQPEIRELFPARSSRRFTHIAVTPDQGAIASVLETLAREQLATVWVSVPYEPEAHSLGGRFPFPQRVGDPAYLLQFDYVVEVLLPPGVSLALRRPDVYRRFRELWQRHRQRFQLVRTLSVPGGVRLRIFRNSQPPPPV